MILQKSVCFRIFRQIKSSKEQHLFVFAVTFDQFYAFLLKKSIHFFQKRKNLTDPKLLNGIVPHFFFLASVFLLFSLSCSLCIHVWMSAEHLNNAEDFREGGKERERDRNWKIESLWNVFILVQEKQSRYLRTTVTPWCKMSKWRELKIEEK